MTIKNVTKNIILSENVQKAKNWKDKTIGLIGTKKPQSLLLRTHFGIHTFGMRYPIDVLILNSQNKVVALKENLKPNRMFLWNPHYDNVLELPKGTINKSKTQLGDHLLCKDK